MNDAAGLAELIADLRDMRERYDLAAVSAVARLPDGVLMSISVGLDDDLVIEREAPR